MSPLAKVIKVKRRRAERVWAALICGALGGCLALTAAVQIATGPGLRAAARSAPAPRIPSQAYTLTDDDEIRTGSILITPSRGDKCQHNLFDNYTGQLWSAGPVSCEAALVKSNEKQSSGPERLHVIGGAFRAGR